MTNNKRDRHREETDSSFKVDLQDERFKALLENDAFAIDRTNPNFRDTTNMQAIMAAKRKKALDRELREEQEARERLKKARSAAEPAEASTSKKASEGSDVGLSQLVASVKRKSMDVAKRKTIG